MYQFKPQLTKLYESSPEYPKYYTTTNGYYTGGYGMPNCTCYALGRVLENCSLNNVNAEVKGLLGNGGKWGEPNYIGSNWLHGTLPMLGAVAVFEETGEAGHVAIVEAMNEDGTVSLSNSGWSDTNRTDTNPKWWWLKENVDVNNYYNYTFKYYLYPPFIKEFPPQPVVKKSWIPLAVCGAMQNNL